MTNDTLLRALRGEPTDYTPVWFMRQAGRSLRRYRELRADAGMFEILRDPERAADITAMPLEYFPVDACVLYNDLSTPFFAAGLHVDMKPGFGPVVDRPIRSAADVDALRPFDPRDDLAYTMDAIRLLVARLDVPVLGFVGAPFTLCSYLIDRARGERLSGLKSFMWREPEAWHRLADFWADHLADYAIAQHEAGAAAVQVFDSWAGALSPEDYVDYVMPHMERMFDLLEGAGVPTINFYTGNPALLALVAETGGDCMGVDWRLPLGTAREIVGDDRSLQGNLDPACLLAGRDYAIARAGEVLDQIHDGRGHIFNVGHGLLPETDPDVVRAVVDFVHERSSR
ncbi:MAG TPA: uroporphyrinogen decarboxylase [Longimicrobiales bacterium]|nr:uroporphyrinogen decarboxylase [Longimicrobiales bacterium]